MSRPRWLTSTASTDASARGLAAATSANTSTLSVISVAGGADVSVVERTELSAPRPGPSLAGLVIRGPAPGTHNAVGTTKALRMTHRVDQRGSVDDVIVGLPAGPSPTAPQDVHGR